MVAVRKHLAHRIRKSQPPPRKAASALLTLLSFCKVPYRWTMASERRRAVKGSAFLAPMVPRVDGGRPQGPRAQAP
jgi:hypothetical protein